MTDEPDDVGEPISYRTLARKTPVYSEDGAAVGIVKHVMALEHEDIFDGIVVHSHHGDKFVPGELVGPIHERAVALKCSPDDFEALGAPEKGPAAMAVDEAALTDKHLHGIKDIGRNTALRMFGR